MKNWIEHAPSGRIYFSGRGSELPVAGDHEDGILVETEQVVDVARSLYVDGSVLDLGERPSPMHVIDVAARAWALWTPPGSTPLQVAQDAKWAEIKAERDRLETAGFPYFGKWIDSDARSVQRITGAVQSAQAALAAGAAFEIGWTCSDNSVIELDGQEMLGMTVALAAHANDLHVTARGLRALIYAEDATEASVAAVAWPAVEVSP